MLNTISWQQYLTAIILLSAAWYSYIGLRYYRNEVAAWLKIKPRDKSTVPAVANKFTVVMGEAKPDTDTGLYPSEELIFSGAESDGISDQTLPLGPGDDLLAEAKALVDAYGDNDNKNEFLSFLKLLLDKYEVFRDEISLPAVIQPLREFADSRLPFRLKETEWPLTF
ncbi:hypothetical protein IDJ77_03995 [Mucilaginibacter sp. ZT4R22]|uniref:Uncharacterized protein n=1 Tax=Mucilaginibacter pankratovii TaxID=2772110 RepID=A0ABR7WKW7_9SPHI|nr:hypothetical protein [Mucilaginibacter pankratovii]MBD1362963.1 hypothetical protein [Mucilaginibacter pankratovii]